MIKVLIGIQARSTSERFPRKVLELIDGKPMVEHVLEACNKAARNCNKRQALGASVSVALLVPEGDEALLAMGGSTLVLEGPEHDVLTRYHTAATLMKADYVVRVTADCPLIPYSVITKHIDTALMNEADYCSNVYETFRTAPDGFDCEVISRRLLDYLHQTAADPYDREHVTPLARKKEPRWIQHHALVGFLVRHDGKLSVDTPEDLERVRDEKRRIKQVLALADEFCGRNNVHRY